MESLDAWTRLGNLGDAFAGDRARNPKHKIRNSKQHQSNLSLNLFRFSTCPPYTILAGGYSDFEFKNANQQTIPFRVILKNGQLA
jgi:hypothetical protein